jgi:hypothetical protein
MLTISFIDFFYFYSSFLFYLDAETVIQLIQFLIKFAVNLGHIIKSAINLKMRDVSSNLLYLNAGDCSLLSVKRILKKYDFATYA